MPRLEDYTFAVEIDGLQIVSNEFHNPHGNHEIRAREFRGLGTSIRVEYPTQRARTSGSTGTVTCTAGEF